MNDMVPDTSWFIAGAALWAAGVFGPTWAILTDGHREDKRETHPRNTIGHALRHTSDPDRSPCPHKFDDGHGYDPDFDGLITSADLPAYGYDTHGTEE